MVCFPAISFAQITNGGFEPGSPTPNYVAVAGGSTLVPGWTTTDSGVEWADFASLGYSNSPNGSYALDLANLTFSAGGIEQTFATTPGQTYNIAFYFGTHQVAGRDGTAEIEVTVDAMTQTFTIVHHAAPIQWELKTFTFIADDASATLHFHCLQDANLHFAYIDGIDVWSPVCAQAVFSQITNGGFEPGSPTANYVAVAGGSTTVPGWTTTDTGVEWADFTSFGYSNSPNGGYSVDLANLTFSAGGIEQTFVTTPGQLYNVTFYFGTHQVVGRDGTAEIEVTVDAVTQTFTTVNHAAPVLWELKTFTFIADDASATLHFRCVQDPIVHFAYIDGIDASPEPNCVAYIDGHVTADCPSPGTPLYGVVIDAYETGGGDLVASTIADAGGAYSIELDAGDYTVTAVKPLGYGAAAEEVTATVTGGQTTTVDFALSCLPISADPRGIGFWKHQVGVATGGKGTAQIDAATLCGYLDLIEDHFNSNVINQVIVYDPPADATCDERLLVAKELLNLKGNVGMTARARQQLMSLLLNVAGNYLSLRKTVSVDGATVSQAITYCDFLIDDADLANDATAKGIAEQINDGTEIAAGVIPLTTDDIAYAPKDDTTPIHVFALEGAHPNPFNPQTTISYSIAAAGRVQVLVYDVRGALVQTLVDGNQPAGRQSVTWDGTDGRGSPASSGIYFVRLESGGQAATRKIALLK
jgi:hypothetical protein